MLREPDEPKVQFYTHPDYAAWQTASPPDHQVPWVPSLRSQVVVINKSEARKSEKRHFKLSYAASSLLATKPLTEIDRFSQIRSKRNSIHLP